MKDSAELIPTFREQRDAWESFITNTPMNVQRLDIPYENSSMPGWFVRPAQAPAGAPTLILVNGSDGSLAALWGSTGAAALERGYNVLLFDGPGQQSQLFERDVPFRPDWEHVLTPVFDFVAGLDGVDPARIAVYGVSQGGYWVARALAFEHRFAAAITDPGVVDVSASWTSQLPKSMNKLLDEGQNEKFDKEMSFGMKFSPETERTWQFRARPYGTTGFAETIQAVRGYNMADVAGKITTPLLITSPEGEQFWPGQSEQLASLTDGVSTLVTSPPLRARANTASRWPAPSPPSASSTGSTITPRLREKAERPEHSQGRSPGTADSWRASDGAHSSARATRSSTLQPWQNCRGRAWSDAHYRQIAMPQSPRGSHEYPSSALRRQCRR